MQWFECPNEIGTVYANAKKAVEQCVKCLVEDQGSAGNHEF